MRWFRVSPVAGAALLLGLLCACPAAAQQGPDHLHVDLALVGCGTLEASGYQLPAGTRLDVRFVNPSTGDILRAASATTSADGALALTAKVPLDGTKADRPFAFSELTIPGTCPLPFTGPARWPALAGTALCLILLGSMLVGVTAYRGRHRAGRHPHVNLR